MKILFVEDDRIIASGLCYSLTQDRHWLQVISFLKMLLSPFRIVTSIARELQKGRLVL